MKRPDAYLEAAPIVRPIYPEASGKVQAMDTRAIGMAVVALGGGRTRPQDPIDYAVGFSDFAALGEAVGADRPLALAHVRSETQFEEAQRRLRAAGPVGEGSVDPGPPIIRRIVPEEGV
jgi:thymidine phosphorylase